MYICIQCVLKHMHTTYPDTRKNTCIYVYPDGHTQAYYTFIQCMHKLFTATSSFFNIALMMYIKSSYENYTLFSLTIHLLGETGWEKMFFKQTTQADLYVFFDLNSTFMSQ